ncbi:glycosyltransferase [Acetobacter conturbans]|uniref:Glycosyltransferase n=1 Tax=Acetobacter conturbans TaxID=1737472 RepID=A0ABX0K364_9PROT|nr:glycosyltransferase [Acetobacter conturbans]NHN89584.1 glycosyltransferase [Acetobacter conturbans]
MSFMLENPTCVVTVTYGERVYLLAEVVKAALRCGACRAVVVDNGTPATSKTALAALRRELGADVLHIVTLADNEGSAGGFHAGLAYAAGLRDMRFLWVLDDDTVPEASALTILLDKWRQLGADESNAMMSMRVDKNQYRKVLARKTLHWVEPNAFFDFNLAHLWNGGKRRARVEQGCIQLGVAAYGGLWFARSWLDRIALPPRHYHLYFDDYAFSAQIPASGGHIWLSPKSQLHDIDLSWRSNKDVIHPWLDPATEERRVFCSIRNRIWLEKPLSRSRLLYGTNMVLYFLVKVILPNLLAMLLRLHSAPAFVRRLRLISRAIRAGLS